MTAEGSRADMAVTTARKDVSQLELPKGFRFHPTDEELVTHYLCPKAESQTSSIQIIADVDIYKFDPWNLPELAIHGENEWYFFSPRDRKYPNGSRPNRSAGSGYWKATGTDKHISCTNDDGNSDGSRASQKMKVGVKKALVFYEGRPPNGAKTSWIMHEYRLADSARTVCAKSSGRRVQRKGSLRLDDWVLCRIYKKKSNKSKKNSSGYNGKREEEEREDSVPEENNFDSSSTVEDFLASLPEIENSRLHQVQMLPNLVDDVTSPSLSFLMGQDLLRAGSIVIDHSPFAGHPEDSSPHYHRL